MQLPQRFIDRYSQILDSEDLKSFLEFCKTPLRKSIRVNTIKSEVSFVKEKLTSYGWKLLPIPWVDYGFWVSNNSFPIGNTLEHFMGFYYVQEASSMIPPLVLDPKPGEYILDMAAAPGSKTTQIAQIMDNKGTIIANDVRRDRLSLIAHHVDKLGVTNVVLTHFDATRFPDFQFDKILLDAPCSSDGLIRKDWGVLNHWGLGIIKMNSALQRRMIMRALDIVKPGGVVVYSTCTLAPEEDEGVLDFVLSKRSDVQIEPIHIKGLKYRQGITTFGKYKYSEAVTNAIRVYPQDNDSEGFFIAKLRRLNA